MDVLIGLVFTVIMLLIAFFTGNHNEKKHYASILAREDELHRIMIVSLKHPPENFVTQELVRGSVVISSNYFTRMLAGLRNFFGADIVFNMKFETASLDNVYAHQQGGAVGTVEVLAYGTAGKMQR